MSGALFQIPPTIPVPPSAYTLEDVHYIDFAGGSQTIYEVPAGCYADVDIEVLSSPGNQVGTITKPNSNTDSYTLISAGGTTYNRPKPSIISSQTDVGGKFQLAAGQRIKTAGAGGTLTLRAAVTVWKKTDPS
jgi:hypothetical protein